MDYLLTSINADLSLLVLLKQVPSTSTEVMLGYNAPLVTVCKIVFTR